MMNDKIDKVNKKHQAALVKISEYFKSNDILPFNVGDILISNRAGYYKVLSLKPGKSFKWKDSKKEYFDDVKVKLQFVDADGNVSSKYTNEDDAPDKPFEKYLSEMDSFIALQISPKELEQEALQTILKPEKESEEQEVSDSTDLMVMNDKKYLETVKTGIERRSQHLEAKSRVLHSLMEAKRSELYGIMQVFEKQIKKIRRVIATIELYLGINEDIVQLQEGPSALMEEPIHIRQQILFMDEEVGNPDDLRGGKDGWDFQNIEDFEKWLVIDNHYDKLLPEKKGIVVLCVRRRDKHYSENAWTNSYMNIPNKNTFFLMRNGDNIYCIWADLNVGRRFFPLRTEIQVIFDELNSDKHMWDSDKEKIEDTLYFYKRNFILMQGLIERTTMFHPLAFEGFNVLKPESYGEYVNFIYDDEAALPSGKLSYKQWKEQLNKGIQRGSRIYVSRWAPGTGGMDRNSGISSSDSDRLVTTQWVRETYDAPSPGMYTVEEGKEEIRQYIYKYHTKDDNGKKKYLGNFTEEDWEKSEEESGTQIGGGNIKAFKGNVLRERTEKYNEVEVPYLYIKYNPGGTVYGGWGSYESHDRKNKISYKIYEDDSFIFNYDVLPFEDIDFYLESRVDRHNYISMMPTLWDLKRLRIEEMKWETDFANLTKHAVKKELNLHDKYAADVLLCVWEAITWWKHKVIWKRPISKDDAKALRMIKRRVISKMKEIRK